jgi:hypothetical protein
MMMIWICGSKSQTKAKETASAEACLSVTAALGTRHGLYQRVPLSTPYKRTVLLHWNGNGVLLNRGGVTERILMRDLETAVNFSRGD